MNNVETLKARFPTLGISYGYIGTLSTGHDDRSFRVFTNLKEDDGRSVSVIVTGCDFDAGAVAVTLDNILMHRKAMAGAFPHKCMCRGCIAGRMRRGALTPSALW